MKTTQGRCYNVVSHITPYWSCVRKTTGVMEESFGKGWSVSSTSGIYRSRNSEDVVRWRVWDGEQLQVLSIALMRGAKHRAGNFHRRNASHMHRTNTCAYRSISASASRGKTTLEPTSGHSMVLTFRVHYIRIKSLLFWDGTPFRDFLPPKYCSSGHGQWYI